jgi:hypothetical protein
MATSGEGEPWRHHVDESIFIGETRDITCYALLFTVASAEAVISI